MKELIFAIMYIVFILFSSKDLEAFQNLISEPTAIFENVMAEQPDSKQESEAAEKENENMEKEQNLVESSSIDVNTIHDNDLIDLMIMNKNEMYPLDLSYDYNDEYITSIMGVYSDIKVLSAIDALHAIYSVKSLLGLEDPSSQLVLDRVDESIMGNYYLFQQYYDNVKVWGSTITVSVDAEGKTCSLSSYIIPNKTLKEAITTTTPNLSESDSIKIIKDQYPNVTDFFAELIIYTEDLDDKPVLAYHFVVAMKDEPWEKAFILDANTGEIILEASTEKE